jgi:hypothetical protein
MSAAQRQASHEAVLQALYAQLTYAQRQALYADVCSTTAGESRGGTSGISGHRGPHTNSSPPSLSPAFLTYSQVLSVLLRLLALLVHELEAALAITRVPHLFAGTRFTTQITCFTSTKVQIPTLEEPSSVR